MDQEVAPGRDLVTYGTTSWVASNNPGEPLATDAHARRWPNRGSARDWPAGSTNGAGYRLYWRHDTQAWCRTSDASDCAGWDEITPCNANTLLDAAWPRVSVNNRPPRRQTREQKPGWRRNKTGGNKRRIPLDETLRRKPILNKTEGIIRRRNQTKSSAPLTNFVAAFKLSQNARQVIRQNLVVSLGTVAVLVAFAMLGKIPLTLGVVGHEGSTVVVVLNSLRLLFMKTEDLSTMARREA